MSEHSLHITGKGWWGDDLQHDRAEEEVECQPFDHHIKGDADETLEVKQRDFVSYPSEMGQVVSCHPYKWEPLMVTPEHLQLRLEGFTPGLINHIRSRLHHTMTVCGKQGNISDILYLIRNYAWETDPKNRERVTKFLTPQELQQIIGQLPEGSFIQHHISEEDFTTLVDDDGHVFRSQLLLLRDNFRAQAERETDKQIAEKYIQAAERLAEFCPTFN